MKGTGHIGPVDLVPSKYEVDVEGPGGFSIKNGDSFFMNFFADLKYRRAENTIDVASYRTSGTLAHARHSRL